MGTKFISNQRFQEDTRYRETKCIQRPTQGCVWRLVDLGSYSIFTAYQTEIDNLTKRSKTSENAFLHVYKILAEAPDPYPLLEAAVVRHYLDLTDIHLLTTGVGSSCESGRGS